jgi:hypothetical protein
LLFFSTYDSSCSPPAPRSEGTIHVTAIHVPITGGNP